MEYNYKIYLLFGLVLLGFINKGLTKPTTEQDETEYPQDNQEYDDEDDDQTPVENKATENNANDVVTQPPYFESPHEKHHVKLGSIAELKCAAKQLSSTNVILWYKEENIIANGKSTTRSDDHIKITNDSSLIIQNVTSDDAGNYYCEVIPQKVRLHIEVEIDSSPEEQQAPAEHNQASQVGQVTATESNNNQNDNNGCNGQISQSFILTLSTIVLTSVLRI